MRTRVVVLTVLAAVAVTATVTSFAWRADAAPRRVQVFEPEEQGYSKTIDAAPEGLGAGDRILEDKPLVDPRTGRTVGSAVTNVNIVRELDGGDLLAIIDCTVRLREGTIVFYGAARFSELGNGGATLEITGGASAFDGAGGTVVVRSGELTGKPGTFMDFRIR